MTELPLWQRAAAFAARAHQGQLRKDGLTPYFSHPARVAIAVTHIFGCDEPDAIAVAFLHDTIEDTRTDYDDLEREFGPRIADAVAALTKNTALPEQQREPEYDARLAAAEWIARLVKLADQYDNLSDSIANHGRRSAGPSVKSRLEHARRALDLARPDSDAGNQTMARGVAALERLCDEAKKRSNG